MGGNLIYKININNYEKDSFQLIKDSLNSEIHSFIFNKKKAILKLYKSDDEIRIKETQVLTLLKKEISKCTRNY